MSTDLVKYTPMSLDDLDAQERSIGFGQGGGQFYQFKDGRNIVRFLPGVNGRQGFVQFWKHFVKASADGKAWGGPCPLKMAKLPCPICQIAAKLSRGSDADRDLAGDLTPRGRVIANIIDRAAPDTGPQVAEFGKAIYDAIKDYVKTFGEDPTHPVNGVDMIIEKSGSGLRTEYKVLPARKNSPLHSDAKQLDEWIDAAVDLSQYAVVASEAEIATRLGGTVIGHLLGARGQAAPRAAAPARAKASQAVDVDSDDDLNY
jgi:hypothetical protein